MTPSRNSRWRQILQPARFALSARTWLRRPNARLLLAGGVCWALACGLYLALQSALHRQSAASLVIADFEPPRPIPPNPEHFAGALRMQLPAGQVRQERLADLLELGLQLGLSAPRTETRLLINHEAGLEWLSVTMPVQGSYAQVRQFLGEALAQDSALSLDGVRLRRINPQAIDIEAELQWSLHARTAEPSR
jgi:hypothetical protein